MKKHIRILLFRFQYLVLTLVLFGFSNLQARETLNLTLDEYIRKVRNNHPKIKVEEMKPKISKTMVEEDPVVSGYGGMLSSDYQQNISDSPLSTERKILNLGWNYKVLESGTIIGVRINNTQTPVNGVDYWSSTTTLSVNQPLLWNGILRNQINSLNIKRYDYEISQVVLEMTVSEIISKSLLLYRQYEIAKEVNALSKELLASAEEILAFNRKRVSIGSVSRSDILNTESQIIKNQIDIQNSDNNLLALQESLLYSMGYPELDSQNLTLKIEDNSSIKHKPVTYDDAWEKAMKEHLQFQLYSLQLAASDNAYQLGKKAVFPQLDVFANYSFLGRNSSYGEAFKNSFDGIGWDNTDLTLGLKFSISTELAKYRLATQRPLQIKEQTQKNLAAFQDELRNNIRAKVRSYNNAFDNYQKNKKVVTLTRERYKIAREEYFIGKLDYTRLLQVEQELKQATISYLNGKIAYYTAELELESAEGIILDKYGVR